MAVLEDTLARVNDGPDVRNEASGDMEGPVVQAGSIGYVALTGSNPTAIGRGEPQVAPRQLPLAIRDFTGRAEHVAALDALLPNDGGSAGAVVISAVDGAAGIGKTTLAVHWAHQVQDRFPDGTLHTNLRGYGPSDPATVSEVLEGFLRGLGIPAGGIPHGVEAQAALFRSLLAGRRVLIVLDNANSADQVRPLLPGSPGCVVVVTSRDSLTGLVVTEGAHRLTLDLLTEAEAEQLVRGIVGPTRAEAEADSVAELIQLCARLPLALRIAAGRAAGSHSTVADVVAELADDRYRLDALSRARDQRTAVRAVFDWSYQRLTASEARLFRRLGLHPGPEIGVHAAAAVADMGLGETRELLDELAKAHLIEPAGRDRYRFHDLLRAYATRLAEDDPPCERDEARERVLRWYTTVGRVLLPPLASWNHVLDTATPSRPEIVFAGPEPARAWFDTEAVNLVAAVRAADEADLHQLTALLAFAAYIALYRRGDFDSLLDAELRGLAAARRSGDRIAEIHALLDLGSAYHQVAQWSDATDAYEAALELAREFGDLWLEAGALNELGRVHVDQGQHARAGEYLRAALPLSTGAQSGRLEGIIEGDLSKACTGLGDYEAALQHAERGLLLRQQVDDRHGEATALRNIAAARQKMGEHSKAVILCEQALDNEAHDRYAPSIAATLDVLGSSLHQLGEIERALACWRDALSIYDKFRDHRAAELRDRLHTLETHRDNHL